MSVQPPSHSDPESSVEDPDVSVIVPVFNSASWLDQCLSSVLSQKDVRLEVICVDDGSTDDSITKLQHYVEADPRVRVISQLHSGQSVARNTGIRASTGRYILFLDSDDYWIHDVLGELVHRADSERLDLLLFDGVAVREGSEEAESWKRYRDYYARRRSYPKVSDGAGLMAAMHRHRDYRPHVGLYIARRELICEESIRFIPGIVHQDNAFTFSLFLNARRAAHVKIGAYARRVRSGSTITSLTPEVSARGYFLAHLDMRHEAQKHALPRRASRAIAGIVNGTYEAARKQIGALSETDAAEIRDLAPDPAALMVYDALREGVPLREESFAYRMISRLRRRLG